MKLMWFVIYLVVLKLRCKLYSISDTKAKHLFHATQKITAKSCESLAIRYDGY